MEEMVRAFVGARTAELEAALRAAIAAGLPSGVVPLEHYRARLVSSLALQLAGAPDAVEDPQSALASTWKLRARASESGAVILADHAWSLACEQHPDLRVPAFDVDVAKACFTSVYRRDFRAVESFVAARYGAKGLDGESIAQSAWTQVFDAYWSSAARKPFGGRARIRTVVRAAARRLAEEELRTRAAGASGDDDDPDGAERGPIGLVDPAADREEFELQRAFDECLETLPPKRRIVAQALWRLGLRPSEVREKLGLPLPAIANHKTRAAQALADCMDGKGYEQWESAKLRSSR